MKVPGALKKKVLGVPVGIWLLLGAAGVGVGLYLRKRAENEALDEDDDLSLEENDAAYSTTELQEGSYYSLGGPITGGAPTAPTGGGGAINLKGGGDIRVVIGDESPGGQPPPTGTNPKPRKRRRKKKKGGGGGGSGKGKGSKGIGIGGARPGARQRKCEDCLTISSFPLASDPVLRDKNRSPNYVKGQPYKWGGWVGPGTGRDSNRIVAQYTCDKGCNVTWREGDAWDNGFPVTSGEYRGSPATN